MNRDTCSNVVQCTVSHYRAIFYHFYLLQVGSLTSRGMPLMPGLQHLGGKQTRAAAQPPSEGVSVDA